jgi:hypothetical protein
MKRQLTLLILLIALASCRDSAIIQCIDSKVEQGISASHAEEKCEEARADSQIIK